MTEKIESEDVSSRRGRFRVTESSGPAEATLGRFRLTPGSCKYFYYNKNHAIKFILI